MDTHEAPAPTGSLFDSPQFRASWREECEAIAAGNAPPIRPIPGAWAAPQDVLQPYRRGRA